MMSGCRHQPKRVIVMDDDGMGNQDGGTGGSNVQ